MRFGQERDVQEGRLEINRESQRWGGRGSRQGSYSCDHDASTSSRLEEILNISDRVDIAIGKHWNRDCFDQSGEGFPIGWTVGGGGFGSEMNFGERRRR